jgi:hypothetical protein
MKVDLIIDDHAISFQQFPQLFSLTGHKWDQTKSLNIQVYFRAFTAGLIV